MKTLITAIALLASLFAPITLSAQEKPRYKLSPLRRGVNSTYHDTSPVITPDGKTLYFVVSDHPENYNGTENSQDIWYSTKNENGEWSDAVHMGDPFNQNQYNQVLSVSKDGNRLFVREFKNKHNIGFAVTRREGNGWSKLESIRIPKFKRMARGRFSGGFMSYDGKVILLYFNEKENEKYSDLYVSMNEDGNWSEPKFIKSLNTYLDEFGPYLAPDNKTLYFASNRAGGFGSTDIYQTTRKDDTWLNWTQPENIGAPINTGGFDAYYAVGNTDTLVFTARAYMSADGGHMDLHTLQKVTPKVHKLVVKGGVYDKKDYAPVPANLRIEHEGEVVEITQANLEDGTYEVKLPDSGKYYISAQAEGYLAKKDSFYIKQARTDTEVYLELLMQPMEVGLSVRLNNIFFDYNKATLRPESNKELDKVVEMMQQNPGLSIEIGGHTDNQGSAAYNRDLSQRRAQSVKDYLTAQWIKNERIIAKGYGEADPEVPNTSDENRQVNRRVEFTILSVNQEKDSFSR